MSCRALSPTWPLRTIHTLLTHVRPHVQSYLIHALITSRQAIFIWPVQACLPLYITQHYMPPHPS